MTHRIVFFDFETAGLEPTHEPIQLAAVATESFVEVDAFEAKVVFDESLADPEALAANHYDPAIWREQAKPEAVVVREFARFLDKHATIEKTAKSSGKPYRIAWLAGHNIAKFDVPRLDEMFKRYGQFLAADIFRPLDTMQLAHWHALATGASESTFGLTALCERFDIDTSGAHDALADARMCVKLAQRLQHGMSLLGARSA